MICFSQDLPREVFHAAAPTQIWEYDDMMEYNEYDMGSNLFGESDGTGLQTGASY